MSEKILIIDDEVDMLDMLKTIIEDKTTYQVSVTPKPQEALRLLGESPFDLVITDLRMPDLGGISLLEEIRGKHPDLPVIIISAYGTIDTAVEAMQKGAFSYITKPFKQNEILVAIAKALAFRRLQTENILLRRELGEQIKGAFVFGDSPAMQEVYETVLQVAKTTAAVLINGEPGSGREWTARTIHYQSDRREQAFVPLNCAVVPEPLMESELFGQVKGYRTDTAQNKTGLVEEAHGGTLFLEEVETLSPLIQTKLIQLMQEGTFRPQGGTTSRKADIRIIASTQVDLGRKVRQREFQGNLYYRLNVIQITLPPLRERREDIPLLARHFLEKYARLNQKTIKGLAPEALGILTGLPWPGNVRELENVIERGVILSKSGVVEIANLFPHPPSGLTPADTDDELYRLPFKESKDRLISNFHQEYLRRALARNQGVVALAARESGLERPYFHKLLRESRIRAKDFKPT